MGSHRIGVDSRPLISGVCKNGISCYVAGLPILNCSYPGCFQLESTSLVSSSSRSISNSSSSSITRFTATSATLLPSRKSPTHAPRKPIQARFGIFCSARVARELSKRGDGPSSWVFLYPPSCGRWPDRQVQYAARSRSTCTHIVIRREAPIWSARTSTHESINSPGRVSSQATERFGAFPAPP